MHDRAYLDGPPRLVEHVVQAVGENAGFSQPRGHSTSGVLGVPPAEPKHDGAVGEGETWGVGGGTGSRDGESEDRADE